MNTKILSSFFILSSRLNFETYRIIRLAESCYCLKDAEGQKELGIILKGIPEFNSIGAYYEAFYLTRIGQFEESRKNLERTLNYAPDDYKAKAFLALSGLEERRETMRSPSGSG